MVNPAFIADVHAGKLARLLRILGFNTVYANSLAVEVLLEMAKQQDRWLLTKNFVVARSNPCQVFAFPGSESIAQLQQVIDQLKLKRFIHPFCEADKVEDVQNFLDDKAGKYAKNFCYEVNVDKSMGIPKNQSAGALNKRVH